MNQKTPQDGKVAIVTGAARGIGAAIALRLAAEGCQVAVLDLDEAACAESVTAIEAAGGRALAVGVDVTNEGSVAAAVARVAVELGPPLVLVNNAGVMRGRMMYKMSLEEWDQVMSVNLRGAFLMSRETHPHMRTARWGRIVNISSTAALGLVGAANYSAAKSGIQGFTKTLAIELGPHGITANAIAPGFVVTDMTRATAAELAVPVEQLEQEAVRDIPVGRAGRPEDMAQAVAFFADPRSGFVSGQVLYVAGGPKA